MKLTKEVVEVLKYHGYITFTESTETFLKYFKTVEDLGDKGFITDRGAVNFLRTIFDENGVNHSAEVTEEELEKQATETPETHVENVVEEPIVEDNKNSQGPSGEFDGTPIETPEEATEVLITEEPVVEPEPEVVEEPENVDPGVITEEPEPEIVEEPIVEPEPEVVEEPVVEPEKPVAKPKTTTKKTTTTKKKATK